MTVTSHADSTVDWVLVSLRPDSTTGLPDIPGSKRAAVIFEGGTVATPGADSLYFEGFGSGNY